ncbi:MAG: YopX family protein [Treponema sp.]|nr:YopX family protein [Treponema sp.]
MREHIYRGKRIDNGEWVEGDFMSCISCICTGLDEDGDFNSCCVDIDPNTVGEFTGLLDKNSVKIFEGDIFHDEDNYIGIVEFNKGRFVGDVDGRTYYSELYLDAGKSVVIGNIHDNPELLEAK